MQGPAPAFGTRWAIDMRYAWLPSKRFFQTQETGERDSTVKYLREVTPYFRKASIIQEVGWELQRGFLSATPPPPKSPPRADTRYLPLQLCRLTRAHPSSDPESKTKVKRTSEIEELNPTLGLSWTERKTARENSCAVKRGESRREETSAVGAGAERGGDRRDGQ
ncbi:SNTB1 protein, partial [Acromyrmex heyeri]